MCVILVGVVQEARTGRYTHTFWYIVARVSRILNIHLQMSCVERVTKFCLLTYLMWANAQCDGRRAEHRWRPLFNASAFR